MKAMVNHNYFKGLSRKDYIQKANEIIEKEGAGAVSIRRIAKEMGCSSTSMYRYFTNRDELLYYAELPTLRNYIKRLNQAEKSWKNIWDKASEINQRVDLFISDLDEIVHALASDLKGYSTYGHREFYSIV